MATNESRKLFVNIAVRDLKKSMEFFSKLGFTFNKQFTDDKAACLVISGDAYFMLLTEPFFRSFTDREPADTTRVTEGMFALSCSSRAEVDEMVRRAIDAGGAHHWEVLWMDPNAIQ
jgi:predicted lactoylglutathione lyase